MTAQFKTYNAISGISPDYFRVRDFLIRRGNCEFTYARWDWMITHPNLCAPALGRIGLWERDGVIEGAALFDCEPGVAYMITLKGREALKAEMLAYAEEYLRGEDGAFGVMLSDGDARAMRLLAKAGYIATTQKEADAAFYPRQTSAAYALPAGFRITDMQTTYDPYQYGRVLWKGFNHELNGEGEYAPTDEDARICEASMLRANVDLTLRVAAVAPDGNFAAYCGLWYDPDAGYAVVEPLATDPAYRKMGLGRAVALEAISRAARRGARLVTVGSSQQFYYSIGFRPYAAATLWRKTAL